MLRNPLHFGGVMRFPVDYSKMRFRVVIPPRPDVDFNSGAEKIRDGKKVMVATLSAMDGEDAEQIRIRYPDTGVQVAQEDPVVPVGLSCLHWSMGDRSGLSFAADTLAPETAPRPAPASKGAEK